MNKLESASKRLSEFFRVQERKKVFDDLKRAKLRLKKFREWQKWKKKSFVRTQERLNTITKKKCKVCKEPMMAKKQKYCSNRCSYIANQKLAKKRRLR